MHWLLRTIRRTWVARVRGTSKERRFQLDTKGRNGEPGKASSTRSVVKLRPSRQLDTAALQVWISNPRSAENRPMPGSTMALT